MFAVADSRKAGDSWSDIQSWLCTTANALMPGRCFVNKRASILASILWAEVSPMWQSDATIAEDMFKSLHEEVVAAAVSFSLQLRKCRSSMSIQFPSSLTAPSDDSDRPGEREFCLTPELKVASGGSARDDERTVVVESRRRTLQLRRRGL